MCMSVGYVHMNVGVYEDQPNPLKLEFQVVVSSLT